MAAILSTFSDKPRIAVIGATGGIGAALVRLLAAEAEIVALSRSGETVTGATKAAALDLLDEDSIAGAAAAAGDALDLVIVATGVLRRAPDIAPEKTWRQFSKPAFDQVFAINATGPALVAKHFLPRLRRGRKAVFAALSARVGSIGDNRLGGWASYRASKAALNMIVKTVSIELARRNPAAIAVTLHPGTVDTALSRPFQGNVPDDRLFTPERAAAALLGVIDGLQTGDSGSAFAWDGQRIPF